MAKQQEDSGGTTSTTKKKGEILESLTPYKIIPLFVPNKTDFLCPDLPQFCSLTHDPLYELWQVNEDLVANIPESKKLFVASKNDRVWAAYTVVATLALVLSGVKTTTTSSHLQEEGNDDDDDELSCEAWTWVQETISWQEWKQIFRHVQEHLCLVSAPHPLETYAIHVVPFLSKKEVEEATQILQLQDEFPTKTSMSRGTMALRLSQLLRDQYTPRNYGILFHSPDNHINDEILTTFPHACLPTAAIELQSPNRINFIALYDYLQDDNITICSLPLDDAILQSKAKQRCERSNQESCPLCSPSPNLPWKVAVRLGHYYFQHQNYTQAKLWYNRALQQNHALDDIRHALGALHLAQGHYLAAQLTWKKAAAEMVSLGRSAQSHEGIHLQLQKQTAYQYMQVEDYPTPISNKTYTSQPYFDYQCFVTPMLQESECQQLIDIANKHGQWTTGRHYAVPTNDIPVHTVPELLDWFVPWMQQECQPLLMKQFQVSQPQHKRFYVHDAFLVRYKGEQGAKTNHLPCHLDECTHSFVICLNSNFEGGGTYFHDYNAVLKPNVGDVVTFKGDTLRHGGDVVTNGSRYILAVFLYLDQRPSKFNIAGHDDPGKAEGATKHHVQPAFQEAKKQKTNFTFGFSI